MISLTTTISLTGKSPQQIFTYLLNLNKKNYQKWHPKDHKDYVVIKQTPHIIGTIYYFDEQVGGLRLNWKWRITALEKNKRIFSQALFFYPIRIHLTFIETSNGTNVIHDLEIGFRFLGLEKVSDWFVKKFILTDAQVTALHIHAKEEFSNLERLA